MNSSGFSPENFVVIDPPRGRPFGGGGVYRKRSYSLTCCLKVKRVTLNGSLKKKNKNEKFRSSYSGKDSLILSSAG
jgi:hypothetical protein